MTADESAAADVFLDSSAARVSGSVRRALGRGAAVALVVLLSPLLLAVATLVKLTSNGPVLFRQQRLGLHRSTFTMYKFRTMQADNDDSIHRAYVAKLLSGADEPGGENGVYKLSGDPRVTPVGRFLRVTSLDELPQLFNVIRGEMALVGPRPMLSYEAELIPAWAAARFRVRPGMTGLWQVSGRSTVGFEQALRYDVEYVESARSDWTW